MDCVVSNVCVIARGPLTTVASLLSKLPHPRERASIILATHEILGTDRLLQGPTAHFIFSSHGIAENVTGPYNWTALPDLATEDGENPAFVVYTDQKNNTVYSLWIGGYGPFINNKVGVHL